MVAEVASGYVHPLAWLIPQGAEMGERDRTRGGLTWDPGDYRTKDRG